MLSWYWSAAVIEGAVVSADVFGATTTLQMTVNSVLLGSLRSGATISVECNTLKYVIRGPNAYARTQIYFLQSTKSDGWACVPVTLLGNSAFGFLGYP